MSTGTGAGPRQSAIREVISRNPRRFQNPVSQEGQPLKVSEYYGVNTFDLKKMKEKLSKDTYNKLVTTLKEGKKLEANIAKEVAEAVKEWALDQGVSHFCHWFQPQTGGTAEKHDAFLTLDDHGQPLEKFSGSQLVQSEPDASSFPSGGMRTTFEARGYTAWDPSSPIFIVEAANGKTLCIPSVFISYHGDALDEKTGLIRSMEKISDKASELLALIGDTGVKRVVTTLGTEQEYFLIDRAFYALRPDLVMAGRTLLGAQPPKHQQLEDHYFGSIPARVQAFMSEMEMELYKLGVPVKTRHNEVAPSQFETAPIFEEANVAIDHNQLTMETLRKVAKRHGFEALLHEKPFAGINGSGKHSNWSMAVAPTGSSIDGNNLLDPGNTPHQNLRFLLFLIATLKGVHKHSGLLRAGIASPGNDHRLGANEAPPAIISCFLGDTLNRILDEIEKGTTGESNYEQAVLKLGVSKLPEVSKDNTDRNRTSPFAFTGNKFEFRAVGSSASPAFPITLLNAAVADGISEVTAALKKRKADGGPIETAILDVLKDFVKDTKAVRFEGNNYSDEWVKEAERRGLPNLRKTPESLKELVSQKSKKLLTELQIFTEAEVVSRFHIRVEAYIKRLLIEVETLKSMVDTQVLPACFGYQGSLASAAAAAKTVGVPAPQLESLEKITVAVQELQTKRSALEKAMGQYESIGNEEAKAEFLAQTVATTMDEIRNVVDTLEGSVADGYWPLPKYREMLFLN